MLKANHAISSQHSNFRTFLNVHRKAGGWACCPAGLTRPSSLGKEGEMLTTLTSDPLSTAPVDSGDHCDGPAVSSDLFLQSVLVLYCIA